MESTFDEIQEEFDDMLGLGDNKPMKFSVAELSEKNKEELVVLCKEHNVPSYGNKPELVERLLKVEEDDILEARSTIVVVEKGEEDDTTPARGERV